MGVRTTRLWSTPSRQFFADATVDRPEYMDQLVAEGAAVHAYMRYVLGHDVLQPIAGDTLGLLTEGGEFVPLIRLLVPPYPFPPLDHRPTTPILMFLVSRWSTSISVICAGSAAGRPVHSVRLQFGRRVRVHTPVHLEVGLNANKIFTLKAYLPEYPDIRVQQHIDNPLGLLPMTSMERRRRELEGFLQRAKAMDTMDQQTDVMVQLANVLLNLNRAELALQWIDQAERRGGPDDETRHARAFAHNLLGETAEAYKIYSEMSNKQPRDWVAAVMAGRSAQSLELQEMYMRRAIAAAPGRGTAHIDLAHVLAAKGDFAAANKLSARRVSTGSRKGSRIRSTANLHGVGPDVYDALG